jgi:hypothetical protein
MTETAREYLVNRFRTDAVALRERADHMARGAKVAGPDAATSRRMAEACDEVATMVHALSSNGEAQAAVDALLALVPLLEQRAQAHAAAPAVRSVYQGAATRIREVHEAEQRSLDALTAAPDDDESEPPSTPEEFGDEELDDEELDDDDLDAEPRDR